MGDTNQIRPTNLLVSGTPYVDIRAMSPTVDISDGSVSAVAALNAAAAIGSPVLIPPGTYLIDSSVSCTASIVMSGGKFSVTTGTTLTIGGAFACEPVQAFSGAGAVAFGAGAAAEVYPQWWGGYGDGVVDAAPAFRAAVDSIEDYGGTISVPPGLYRLASCDMTREITKDERCAFILKDGMRIVGQSGSKLWLDGETLKDISPFNAGSRFGFIGILQGALNCEVGNLEFTANGWVLDIAFRTYNAVACMGDDFWIHDLYMKNLPGRNMIRCGSAFTAYPEYVHISKRGTIERIECVNGNQSVPGNTVADDCSFVYLEVEHVKIRNSIFRNESLVAGYCGGTELHGSHITVESCLYENLTPAIYCGQAGSSVTGNIVRDCKFSRCSGGIELISPADGCVVSGNQFLDTGLSGDVGLPLWTSASGGVAKNMRVENNSIINTTPETRGCFNFPSLQGSIISGNLIQGRATVGNLGITPGEAIDGVLIKDNIIIPETNYPSQNVGIVSISTAKPGATETIKNVEIADNFFWVPVSSSRFNLAICIDDGGTTNVSNVNFHGNRMINGGLNSVWGTGAALVSGNIAPNEKKVGVSSSISDGGTIPHTLTWTPAGVLANGTVAGESVSVTARGVTTFTVAIKKHDGTAGTTQTIYWEAWR